MKSFRRYSATVNAGSMADIAFLLLIFFLVTTTISADKGMMRKLPSICQSDDCTKNIPDRNILRIALNANQEIMVNDDFVELSEIEELVKSFLDNNGNAVCEYCAGEQSSDASDHPRDAVISLSHDALTKYHLFISVQDEISKAYYKLRVGYTKLKFNKAPEELTKEELEVVMKAYPFIVSEVPVKRSNE